MQLTTIDQRATVYGVNVTEKAGTAAEAEVVLRDGDAAGVIRYRRKLLADRSAFDTPVQPIRFDRGVFLERVAGTSEVIVYL